MKRLLAIAACCGALLGLVVLVAAGLRLASLGPFGDGGLDLRADAGEASRIYAQPLVLRTGRRLGADALEAHLVATAHRRVDGRRVDGPGVGPGEYARDDRTFRIGARGFSHPDLSHPDGGAPGGTVEVRLSRGGRVDALRGPDGRPARALALEPAAIGAFHAADGRDRRPVPLDAVPRHLVDAVLAIEDRRFFEHRGLDLRRIAGALVANLRAGRVVQGGSTLTQQLVKNLYLSRTRSWFRKLQEAPLAVMLELRHDKREILEAYLNEIYLGQRGGVAVHGVGRAAEHWFGRPVSSLALHEAALLAGMLRGPSLYDPRRDPEAARARRDVVLARMHALGRIDDAQLEDARARPLGVTARRRIPRSARYFTDGVRADLLARYGPERLAREGLRVYTSLDLRLQRIASQVVRRGLERLEHETPELAGGAAPLQAALVALDPRDGRVLAMIGGRDHGRSQWNRATDARRQPGSVFKTVAALAALSPEGGEPPPFTLASLVPDAPLTMETPEGSWQPGNHDGEFRGPVTLRQVVEQSLNVPMVRVGAELGPRRIVRAARRLGIESRLRGVPSLVLGTSEVTLLEMTRAYGVLAAEGFRAEPRTLIAVEDAGGEVLERHAAAGEQVLDPAEAHLLTSVLEGVVDRGTGAAVRARGFSGPLAGKTGTTDAYRDAWFIGYVPDLAVGVWVGFDDGRSLRGSGARTALPIFADFLTEALGPTGGRPFRVPGGIERVRVVAAEGHRSGLRCGGEPELFLAGTAPRTRCSPFGWFADHHPVDWWEQPGEPPPVAAPPPERAREPEGLRLRIRLPRWLDPLFRKVGEIGSNR